MHGRLESVRWCLVNHCVLLAALLAFFCFAPLPTGVQRAGHPRLLQSSFDHPRLIQLTVKRRDGSTLLFVRRSDTDWSVEQRGPQPEGAQPVLVDPVVIRNLLAQLAQANVIERPGLPLSEPSFELMLPTLTLKLTASSGASETGTSETGTSETGTSETGTSEVVTIGARNEYLGRYYMAVTDSEGRLGAGNNPPKRLGLIEAQVVELLLAPLSDFVAHASTATYGAETPARAQESTRDEPRSAEMD